jgi:hypothetical protein
MGNYSNHRHPHYTFWMARPPAIVEAAPLPPKCADRTRRIRQLFLQEFHGRCTLDDLGEACEDAGLLDRLTPASMREIVKRALRPIATTKYWESADRAATVAPRWTLEQARDRLR